MSYENETLDFTVYQICSKATAVYPGGFVYPALGLCGESGEVAEKLKKVIRDSDGVLTNEVIDDLEKELGDVLWYIAQLCTELGLSLESVAVKNLRKLKSRQDRGKLQGSGDNR